MNVSRQEDFNCWIWRITTRKKIIWRWKETYKNVINSDLESDRQNLKNQSKKLDHEWNKLRRDSNALEHEKKRLEGKQEKHKIVLDGNNNGT